MAAKRKTKLKLCAIIVPLKKFPGRKEWVAVVERANSKNKRAGVHLGSTKSAADLQKKMDALGCGKKRPGKS